MAEPSLPTEKVGECGGPTPRRPAMPPWEEGLVERLQRKIEELEKKVEARE